jgi:YfiH family protein
MTSEVPSARLAPWSVDQAVVDHASAAWPGWWLPTGQVPGVRMACTWRRGGVSEAPYDSLNLGLHVGDDAQAVQRNRDRVTQALEARPVWLNQVHGTDVHWLNADSPDGLTADAVCTTVPGLACTIMVADCLPVLLTDTQGRVVAAAHAGWRGLAGDAGRGVLDTTVKALQSRLPPSADLLAWLGPCIGPQAFEVGAEVCQAFRDNGFETEGLSRAHDQSPDKWWLDLAGLARQRLNRLGVRHIHGNDSTRTWCTVSNPERWFSHRRDRVSGRFAALIWRE